MDRVPLGRTGLEVSVACLGTGGHSRLGQAYGMPAEHSVAVVRAAVDLGVNFIDTAASYGTEEIAGAAVKGRRDSVVLSTKNQIMRPGTSPAGHELITGAELAERTDASLARLGTDFVDVLYLHGICPHQYEYSVSELLPALKRLQEAGKARFIGISERPKLDPGHEMLTRAVADGHFDVIMVNLNIVNQTALRQVIPVAQGKRIGIQAMCAVRGPLARMDSAQAVIRQAVSAGEIDPADLDPDPLSFLLAEGGAASLAEACYRYCRHAPGVDTVLTGTGSAAHLAENVAAINAPPLPPAVLARLAHIFRDVESVTLEGAAAAGPADSGAG